MHYGLVIPFYLVSSIKRINNHMENPSKSPIKEVLLPTLSDIFGAGELLFDHPTYFASTGMIKTESYG